jgi:hypothetical protein
MAQVSASIFKIPTESPQPIRGAASRARKAAAAKPKAASLVASRVVGVETRSATRGDGEVFEWPGWTCPSPDSACRRC